MSAKHTPGPWQVDGSVPLKNGIAIMAGTYGIAKVWDETTENSDENAANARLIAAAPDMLAVLHAVRAALIKAGALVALAAVDIAIAKAEGRSDV